MKCPACNFDIGEPIYDYSNRITNLLKLRSASLSTLLKKTINLIIKYIPSERQAKSVFYFLQSISKLDDEVVKYGITQYLNGKYYMNQKGYAYLRTMLLNVGKDSEMKKKMERKRYGTIPKERVLK